MFTERLLNSKVYTGLAEKVNGGTMSTEGIFSPIVYAELAEEVNGGDCPILTGGILNVLDGLNVPVPYQAVYLPFGLDGYMERPGECRVFGQEYELDTQATVQMGFDGSAVGYLLEKTVFVPVIHLNDRRAQKQCSSAFFCAAPGALEGNIVATNVDEEAVVVAQKREGGFVVAKEFLETVSILLDAVPNITDRGRHKAWQNFKRYAEVDATVSEVLNLEPGARFGTEKHFRKAVAKFCKIFGASVLDFTEVIIDQQTVRGDRGTTTDRTEELLLEVDGDKHSLVYTCAFPNSIDAERRQLARLSFGKRLGTLTLEQCIESDKAEAVLGYMRRVVTKTPESKEAPVRLRTRLEKLPAEAREWVENTHPAADDHFKTRFPDQDGVLAPVVVGKEELYLVITDISDRGLSEREDLLWYERIPRLREKRSGFRLKGRKINSFKGMNSKVVRAIRAYNPAMEIGTYYNDPYVLGQFRPVIVCPVPLKD